MKSSAIFLLVLAAVVNAPALDVQSAYVGKGRIYGQLDSGIAVPKPAGYIFEAAVRATNTGTLNFASWSQPPFPFPPGAVFPIPLAIVRNPLFLWSAVRRSWSQEDFDDAYPNGPYYISLDTVHDSRRTNYLMITGSYYPNPPQIANYVAALNIDPVNDFTLRWNPFEGGTTNDLITFTVMEATNSTGIVLQTGPFLGAPAALDGTRNSFTLPAGTLASSRMYLARLRFDRITSIDRTNYPSEVGFSSYFAATDFYLGTTGADSNTPPKVIAFYPPQGAVDVPTDAPLIWTFNKTMQRASTVFSTHFTDRVSFWTTDGRSFVAVPVTGHATNVTINYHLQPWGPRVLFGDLLGNPLFTDVASEFQTGYKLLPPAIQPRMDVPTIVSNTAQMVLYGESNRVYAVQFSINLSNWTSFSTNVTLTGPALVTHPTSNTPQRFYRAMVLR